MCTKSKVLLKSIKESLVSVNLEAAIEAIHILLNEGSIIEVYQDYPDAPDELLLSFSSVEDFNAWVDNGCPVNK